jgi:hypothetical protein
LKEWANPNRPERGKEEKMKEVKVTAIAGDKFKSPGHFWKEGSAYADWAELKMNLAGGGEPRCLVRFYDGIEPSLFGTSLICKNENGELFALEYWGGSDYELADMAGLTPVTLRDLD